MAEERTDTPVRRPESFDSVSDFYDTFRTLHPKEVVDDVIYSAHLTTDGRVLEIGCGTGQLSVPLAQHGVNLVAVELGPHLAARAQQNLRQFPNARVETSSFEEWPLPQQKFALLSRRVLSIGSIQTSVSQGLPRLYCREGSSQFFMSIM